jgi:hypothetical protein
LSSQLANATRSSQKSAESEGPVWFWLDDCPDTHLLGLKLLIDGKVVYKAKLRICQEGRSDLKTEQKQSEAKFHFPGGHTFQDTYPTKVSDQVEGDIWQAGADSNDLLLGVSFATKSQILLNTIHIAKPGKAIQSTLDSRIVVKTYPLK